MKREVGPLSIDSMFSFYWMLCEMRLLYDYLNLDLIEF